MRLNPFRRPKTDEAKAPAPKVKLGVTIEDIWNSPVDFNRETRRRARLFGRIWRWAPPQDLGAGGRYVRRHYSEEVFTHPRTRRQRRHRARIVRIMRRGM